MVFLCHVRFVYLSLTLFKGGLCQISLIHLPLTSWLLYWIFNHFDRVYRVSFLALTHDLTTQGHVAPRTNIDTSFDR